MIAPTDLTGPHQNRHYNNMYAYLQNTPAIEPRRLVFEIRNPRQRGNGIGTAQALS